MAQIHTDPEKMRQFAADLKKFADTVNGEMSSMKSKLGRLGDTWQDQQYEGFVSIFSKAEKMLKEFVHESQRSAPLIIRDAAAIEEAQRVNL
jgi:WXG100 family type VII secretion target